MDIDRTANVIVPSFSEQIMAELPEVILLEQVEACVGRITRLENEAHEQAVRYARDVDPARHSLVDGVERKAAKLHSIMDDLLKRASMLRDDTDEA